MPEATRLLDAEEIDVVLLDLHVGSASGLDVLDAVEGRDLAARVVLLSGTAEVTPEVRARVASVLGKPFTLEELARAVADDTSGTLRDA